MPSRLTFSATKLKRDELLLRNLRPYNKPGVYTPVGSPGVNEYIRSDYSVIDSPDALIDSEVRLVKGQAIKRGKPLVPEDARKWQQMNDGSDYKHC